MKSRLMLTMGVIAFCAGAAEAHEPGTPIMMPTGATIGVPVGANPPPGKYFSSRSEYFVGGLYVGETRLPVDVTVAASAAQIHIVPGNTIFGGTYRFMALAPIVNANVSTPFGSANETGLGDITISPLNLSWMLSPGIFVQTGLSFGLPTGNFSTTPGAVQLGSNAFTTAFDVGFSYLRDGWNLSAHANYFIYGENPDTSYRSGNELLLNLTAMKDFGGFSVGPVGYWRKQVTADRNNGAFYGGATSGMAEQVAVGIGFTKNFGATSLNVNYLHDVKVRDAVGGDKIQLNLTMPIGGAK